MMLVITATTPVLAAQLPLLISQFPGFLAPSHLFTVLCSDLVREIAVHSPSFTPTPALHMIAIKVFMLAFLKEKKKERKMCLNLK